MKQYEIEFENWCSEKDYTGLTRLERYSRGFSEAEQDMMKFAMKIAFHAGYTKSTKGGNFAYTAN